MSRSFVASCLVGLILASFSAHLSAEEFATSSPSNASLLSRAKWIDFGIADGRLLAKVLRFGQSRMTSESADGDGNEIRESLEQCCDEGHVQLRYSSERAAGEFVLRVADERVWEIEQRVASTGELFTLKQPERGCLTLTIQNKKQTLHFRGATVWHLLLGEAAPCREALVGMLRTIRPDWNIEASLAEVRAELVQAQPSSLPQAEWGQRVRELSAEDFSVRQAADHALRTAGRPVLVYLSHLNPAELDAEQRLRIRRIIHELATEHDDTPPTAAALVQNDVGVWLNLLDTDQPAQQEKALSRVQQLVGRLPSIDLSATASERRAQIASAKERYSASATTYR